MHKKQLWLVSLQSQRRWRGDSNLYNDDWGVVEAADWLIKVYSCGNGKYWRIADFQHSRIQLEVMLVNAQHIKAVPGRKLMSKMLNGLLNYCNMDSCARFSPPIEQRDLRDLTLSNQFYSRAG